MSASETTPEWQKMKAIGNKRRKALFGIFALLAAGPVVGGHSTGTLEGTVLVTASARQDVGFHDAMDEGNSSSDDGYGNSNSPMPKAPPLPEEIVVYLKKVPGHWKAPQAHAQLDQKFGQFTHRALPVLVGTTVDFTNHDPLYHNVFSNSEENPKFDLGRRQKGETRSVTFRKIEVPVKLYCEIHPKMESNLLVLQNPFFAVVKPGGSFRIEGVPPGTYTLVAWHDYWQPVGSQVTVKAGKTKKVRITLSRVRE